MNLGDYLWTVRKTYMMFSKESKICHRSIAQYVAGEFTAGILNAMKIYAETDGSVEPIDLMSKKDLDKLAEYLSNMSEKKKSRTLVKALMEKVAYAIETRNKIVVDEEN